MARTRQWRRGMIWDLPRIKHPKVAFTRGPKQLPKARNASVSPDAQLSSPQDGKNWIQSVATEVLSTILTHVIRRSLQETIFESYTSSFIPIRDVMNKAINPISYVSVSWRTLYLELVLGSYSARDGTLIATTVNDLVQIREWFPTLNIRGCMLFLGDPNDFLIGPLESHVRLSPFLSDPSIASAVEWIEWDNQSTGSALIGATPQISNYIVTAVQEYDTGFADIPPLQSHNIPEYRGELGSGSDDEDDEEIPVEQAMKAVRVRRNKKYIAEEIASLAFSLSSKVLKGLDIFPNLKKVELPSWAVALAWAAPESQEVTPPHRIIQLLGDTPVSQMELRKQLQALIGRVDSLMMVGYPLSLGGLFLWEIHHPELKPYIGSGWGCRTSMEQAITSVLEPIFENELIFPEDVQNLKAMGWTSHSRSEVVPLGGVMEGLMLSKISPALEELSLVTSVYPSTDVGKKWASYYTLLSFPFLQTSLSVLRKLVLHINYIGHGFEAEEAHYCSEFSRFDEILPNIEHLDVLLHTHCSQLFQGVCRPKKYNGTFVITVRNEGKKCKHHSQDNTDRNPYDLSDVEDGDDDSAADFHVLANVSPTLNGPNLPKALRELLNISERHFGQMYDWDIQIRLETITALVKEGRTWKLETRRFRGPLSTAPTQNKLVLYPNRDEVGLLTTNKRSALLGQQVRNQDRTRWEENLHQASRNHFLDWLEGTSPNQENKPHWLQYPGWDLALPENSDSDDG